MQHIHLTTVNIDGFSIEVERLREFDATMDCNVVTYTIGLTTPVDFTWCEDEDPFASVDAAGNVTMKREKLTGFVMGVSIQ